jgi:glycosyltransferase involved in cell wall biosynthesis
MYEPGRDLPRHEGCHRCAGPVGLRRGGDETYTRNLIQALATVGPDTDYTLFLTQPLRPEMQVPSLECIRRVDTVRHEVVLAGHRAWLYNAADIVVYRSIFEGCGLPPLEVMACGRPVVTANTSSFLEAAGDAAPTMDPADAEALASAIAATLSDAGLRAPLTAEGLQHAAAFSWQDPAHANLAVYRCI